MYRLRLCSLHCKHLTNPSLNSFNSKYAFSSFLDLTENVYNGLLNICNGLASLKQLHSSLTASGIINCNYHLGARIIIKYANFGEHSSARSVFDSIRGDKPNSFLWNTMIRAYENTGCHVETLELYSLMRKTGITPNNYTFPFVLKACASKSLVFEGKVVHGDAIRTGFDLDLYVEAASVTMYAKCGETDEGFKIFDKMPKRDLVGWTAMITGYEQAEQPHKALLLFHKMQLDGVLADAVAIVSVASAVGQLGHTMRAKIVHAYAICNGFLKDLSVGNAIIAMYTKCGNVGSARLVFDSIAERDGISWNSMLLGYSQNGQASEAVLLFEEMLDSGCKPNPVTMLIMVSACAYLGSQHLAELGCSTKLLIWFNKMPILQNDGVWGALLLACRIHGDTELGEIAARSLIELEPKHAGYYVLMSNIYAASNRWQKVVELRQNMKDIGLRKPSAFSVVEFGKEVHGFYSADRLNPYWQEVYMKVDSLAIEIKMAGHVPNLSCVLHDVEDEGKEHILNYHSEKLAVAFGIMKVDPKISIQVTNNLRICNDCHSAFKFVSHVYGRKVVVRDSNRFHHFRDGTCSCNDYW